MPDILGSIFDLTSSGAMTLGTYLICSAVALVMGLLAAAAFTHKTSHSRGFALTLALLPFAVETVIALVNGNIGAGVAVAGAFGLVRFRSAQGTAKEICAIFIAMAVGLACGMGYVAIAAIFTVIACVGVLVLERLHFGEPREEEKELRITVPEGMDYAGAFDGVFSEFMKSAKLIQVKTAAMGSLFRLKYTVVPKPGMDEKRFINELRSLNGNLEISLGMAQTRDEL